MKYFTFYFCLFFTLCVKAQTPSLNESVLFRAFTQNTPPQIRIQVYPTHIYDSVRILRRLKNETNFTRIGRLENGQLGDFQEFNDTNVTAGRIYEYRAVRSSGGAGGAALMYAGIDVPTQEYRGVLIIVLDSIHLAGSAFRQVFSEYQKTLTGDGWRIKKINCLRTDTVVVIKNKIKNVWLEDTLNTKAVLLLGAVPVPYSGNIAPDGHADHVGAWPADGYYGDFRNTWIDMEDFSWAGGTGRQRNTPGDGKFDRSTFSAPVTLQVGRVDAKNMPLFGISETDLLIRYLRKNIQVRTKQIVIKPRGQLRDFAPGAGLSTTAWRNWTNLCDTNHVGNGAYFYINTSDYRNELRNGDYVFSGAFGPGSFLSVGTLNSAHFATDSLRSIFTVMMGSYFGDWDNTNNLLRAPLFGKGPILTNCWAGRPNYLLHPMSMGESIGFAVQQTMNSSIGGGQSVRGVHLALMGDPTLRLHQAPQVKNMNSVYQNNKVTLSWTPPDEEILGYNIYRKTIEEADYQKINTELITQNTFSDSCFFSNSKMVYMLRTLQKQISRTGSYFNHGIGVFDTVDVNANSISQALSIQLTANVPAAPCIGTVIQLNATGISQQLNSIYSWQRNGVEVARTATPQFDLELLQPDNYFEVFVNTNQFCPTHYWTQSNIVLVNVRPISVSIPAPVSPVPSPICQSITPVVFNAVVSGLGTETSYKWIQQVGVGSIPFDIGTSLPDTVYFDNSGNNIRIRLRVVTTRACGIRDSSTSAPSQTLQIKPTQYLSGYITPLPSVLCSNQSLKLSATLYEILPAGASINTQFQWFVNDTILQSTEITSPSWNAPSITLGQPKNGDEVSFRILSNATCIQPSSFKSEPILLNVQDTVLPTLEILGYGSNEVCRGTKYNSLFNFYGQGQNPFFKYFINNIPIDSLEINADTLQDIFNYEYWSYSTPPIIEDATLSIKMRSSLTCANPIEVASTIAISAKDTITPQVSLMPAYIDSTYCLPDLHYLIGYSPNFMDNDYGNNNGIVTGKYFWLVNGNLNEIYNSNYAYYYSNNLDTVNTIQLALISPHTCAWPDTVYSSIYTIKTKNWENMQVTLISEPNPTEACSGKAINFAEIQQPIYNGSQYSWLVNNQISQTTSDSVFSITSLQNGDSVHVLLQSAAACISNNPIKSNSIQVTIFPSANPEFTVLGNVLTANVQPSVTYRWLFNGEALPPPFIPVLTAIEDGNYALAATTINNCTDTSSSISILVTNMNSINKPLQLQIFPNPTQSHLYVYNSPKVFEYKIIDTKGRTISNGISNAGETISVQHLPTGIYLLKVKSSYKESMFKFSKE